MLYTKLILQHRGCTLCAVLCRAVVGGCGLFKLARPVPVEDRQRVAWSQHGPVTATKTCVMCVSCVPFIAKDLLESVFYDLFNGLLV